MGKVIENLVVFVNMFAVSVLCTRTKGSKVVSTHSARIVTVSRG